MVLPTLRPLSKAMQVSEDDPAYILKFKDPLMEDLEQRKNKTYVEWLATALDPRCKDLKSFNKADRAEVWRSIAALLRRMKPAQPEQATSEPPKERLALMLVSDSSSDEEEDSIEACLAATGRNPLLALRNVRRSGPTTTAFDCVPSTEVLCERLFSLSGHIVQEK